MTFSKAIIPAADPEEEPLTIDEVFFSRTDKRGVIQSGNAVFRRVSGFEWDNLLGAPHRVVRHPDMPKAVFWLMWKTIQSDAPMIAYIKNRSASGRWFWVLAVVVPITSGYLSVKIKPTSDILVKVRALYAEVSAAELTLTPDKSADLLLRRLCEMGFATYSEFAAAALEGELALRDVATGTSNVAEARILGAVAKNLAAIRGKQGDLMAEFDVLQSIPTNMRIIASRLEPSGGPISAISDNYKFSSNEISRRLEAFAGNEHNLCQAVANIVRDALTISALARVLGAVGAQFAQEDCSTASVDAAAEAALLTSLEAAYKDQAKAAMMNAERVSGDLNIASGEIRRMMLGLDTIRVMGRVESGRLGTGGVGLSATIDQLDTRHASIAVLLQGLMDLSANTRAGINAYLRQART